MQIIYYSCFILTKPGKYRECYKTVYQIWVMGYKNLKHLLFGLWPLPRVLFCFEHWITDKVQILNDSKIF